MAPWDGCRFFREEGQGLGSPSKADSSISSLWRGDEAARSTGTGVRGWKEGSVCLLETGSCRSF